MRLINADDIPYTMLYKENWMKGTGEEAQGAWKSDIDNMPTIDAVPVKHGVWVNVRGAYGRGLYRCSVCKALWTHWNDCVSIERINENFHYCPNCGAKMDGGKDDGT